jgi:hypothetical protein
MDFINQPNTVKRVKVEKPKTKTKYKVRGWVEDLMESPNRWAVYSRQPMTRQGMMNGYSSIDGYKRRYPHIEWAISKETHNYAICGRYTPTEESQ